MKVKKEYTYSGKGQIWRLLPTEGSRMVIEERDTEKKEAYFSCLNAESGVCVFKHFQFEEKFWTGIEAVHNGVIYMHGFVKPDMPNHSGITAFDIDSQKILWENRDFIFLFIWEDKIYCYREGFESRSFFALDISTGEVAEELGENAAAVNMLREKSLDAVSYEGYFFPEPFGDSSGEEEGIKELFREFKENRTIAGTVEYVKLNGLIIFNCHEVLGNGSLRNTFRAIEFQTKKVIFEEILNAEINAFVPDSFFVKDGLIYLLKEKSKLLVCSFRN